MGTMKRVYFNIPTSSLSCLRFKITTLFKAVDCVFKINSSNVEKIFKIITFFIQFLNNVKTSK